MKLQNMEFLPPINSRVKTVDVRKDILGKTGIVTSIDIHKWKVTVTFSDDSGSMAIDPEKLVFG